MKSSSNGNIEQTVEALRRMAPAQLRVKYQELFGEPTRTGNGEFLFKRCAWRVQSLAEGTLSERARRRAEELAKTTDVRTTLPRPPKAATDASGRIVTRPARETAHDRLPVAGTVLTRTYRGRRVEAKVLPNGFEHDGEDYRSLSAIARHVTGTQWNGHTPYGRGTTRLRSGH